MTILALVLISFVQTGQPDMPDMADILGSELRMVDASTDVRGSITGVEGPAWVGYGVAAAVGAHQTCDGVFDLERGGSFSSDENLQETEGELYVFTRVSDGSVEQVRSVASGCRVRAGGLPVYWISSVSSEDSLRFLDELVSRRPTSDVAESALHAIAWHAGDAPDRSLEALARGDWPIELRGKAVFWMGASRGTRGYRTLVSLMDDVSEQELREKIVFALHVSDADEATSTLIGIAREDRDPEVREKALFWLSQEAGARAAAAIAEAVRDDPELDVKKKAVFALSQLPPEQGVPLLVEVAQGHPQPEIRKKAFFWLGQSGDPRALALIENVLMGDR